MKCLIREIPIHYESYGEGHPIILLHGFGPDHRQMTGCMEPIFKVHAGWKRIYLDLPGMGQTPAPKWLTNADQMLDIVTEFIDAIVPEKSFALVGQSYGAYLLQGVVLRKQTLVDGLLMLCPVIIADSTKREVPKHVVMVRDKELLATLSGSSRQDFNSIAVVQTHSTWKRARDEIGVGLDAADSLFLKEFQSHGYCFSFSLDFSKAPFDKPTLILCGRQDSIVGYYDAWRVLENFPRATFVVLDKAGHHLHIEQKEIFNALVAEWLERVHISLT